MVFVLTWNVLELIGSVWVRLGALPLRFARVYCWQDKGLVLLQFMASTARTPRNRPLQKAGGPDLWLMLRSRRSPRG